MRKILNSLLLFGLLLALNVKADAGPPTLPEIELEISNPDGAKCYDNDDKVVSTLQHGKKYHATQGMYDANKYRVYVNDEINCDVSYKDVIANTKDFKIKDDEKENVKGQILFLENVDVYSGPASIFEKVGTVPKGTKIKPQYVYSYYWYYIEYNNIKGFVSRANGEVVAEYVPEDYENVYMMTTSEVDIEDFSGKKNLGTIPANTEIKREWESLDRGEHSSTLYVTYNGISGFVEDGEFSSFAHKCEGAKVRSYKTTDVYETVEFKSSEDDKTIIISKVVGKIEANKDYDVTYCNENIDNEYYIPSLKGWVIEQEEGYLIVTDKDGEVYDHTKLDDDNKEPEGPTKDTPKEPTDVEPPKKDEPTPKKEESKGLSNDELIMICVGAGIIVAVTIGVTIILVNKRKKENNMSA